MNNRFAYITILLTFLLWGLASAAPGPMPGPSGGTSPHDHSSTAKGDTVLDGITALTVDGNTVLGDAAGDTLTINPTTINWATSAITHTGAAHIFQDNINAVAGNFSGDFVIGNAATDGLNIAPDTVTWSNNPTHSGNHTFSGTLTTLNDVAFVGSATTIGNAATDTLIIDSDTVTWSNNPTHSGNHTFSGNVTANGNNILGNASTDTLTIVPNAVTWSNNPTHSGVHTFTGNHFLSSGLQVSGNLTANGTNNTLTNNATDTLTIGTNAVTWQNNPTHSGNHTFSGTINSGAITSTADVEGDTLTITGGATAAADGSVELPNGIIMKWGDETITANTCTVVTFGTAFPTNAFNAQCTIKSGDTALENPCGVSTLGTVDLSLCNGDSSTQTLFWTAIGN